LGYNNVGRVVKVGSKVEGYRPGQRIFSRMPHVSEYIVAEQSVQPPSGPGNSNVPSSYDVIAPVPENVSSEQAAFTHLFVLGFNALQRGQYRFGENVVVKDQCPAQSVGNCLFRDIGLLHPLSICRKQK
jgi:NADPH:quinone reductase-like Zn-dependent oxidoreductase